MLYISNITQFVSLYALVTISHQHKHTALPIQKLAEFSSTWLILLCLFEHTLLDCHQVHFQWYDFVVQVTMVPNLHTQVSVLVQSVLLEHPVIVMITIQKLVHVAILYYSMLSSDPLIYLYYICIYTMSNGSKCLRTCRWSSLGGICWSRE